MKLIHRILQGIGRMCSSNKLPILIYHRVLEQRDPYRDCTPTLAEFQAQMMVLQRYYRPVSLEEGICLLKQNKLPANSVCITFDDGYLDNLTLAAPLLKSMDIPATVYVASAFSQGDNMWNDNLIDLISDQSLVEFEFSAIGLGKRRVSDVSERKLLIREVLKLIKYIPVGERKTLVDNLVAQHRSTAFTSKMMSGEQWAQLANYNVAVEAHTHDHPIMSVLPVEEQRSQLEQNLACLRQQHLDIDNIGFAYPNGKFTTDYTDETANLVEQLGFKYAVTTHHGICTPSSDFFQLPRVSPWDKRPLYFHLRLLLDILYP